jgi:hypothetical protein
MRAAAAEALHFCRDLCVPVRYYTATPMRRVFMFKVKMRAFGGSGIDLQEWRRR